MKIGEKAKGFEFEEGLYEIFLRRTEYTNRYIGVEGTIDEDRIQISYEYRR